ncbi:hypothetical protein AGMMS50229_17720 [Campylobacterota bacterium]|nr:hypothetical protein AGMMS50229_17720 [Campylobacterota bacterium]
MKRLDCRKCRHFFVTWERSFPYGCKFFGFKGKNLPSTMVLASSGAPCEQYQPKAPTENGENSENEGGDGDENAPKVFIA